MTWVAHHFATNCQYNENSIKTKHRNISSNISYQQKMSYAINISIQKKCRVIIIQREKYFNGVDPELVVPLYSTLHLVQITLLRPRSPHVHIIQPQKILSVLLRLEGTIKRLATLITIFFIKVEIKSAASTSVKRINKQFP